MWVSVHHFVRAVEVGERKCRFGLCLRRPHYCTRPHVVQSIMNQEGVAKCPIFNVSGTQAVVNMSALVVDIIVHYIDQLDRQYIGNDRCYTLLLFLEHWRLWLNQGEMFALS